MQTGMAAVAPPQPGSHAAARQPGAYGSRGTIHPHAAAHQHLPTHHGAAPDGRHVFRHQEAHGHAFHTMVHQRDHLLVCDSGMRGGGGGREWEQRPSAQGLTKRARHAAQPWPRLHSWQCGHCSSGVFRLRCVRTFIHPRLAAQVHHARHAAGAPDKGGSAHHTAASAG